MKIADILRVVVVVGGTVLLVEDFLAYCKKRLNENYAFAWGVFAVALILCGAIPALSGWSHALASNTSPFYVIIGLIAVWVLFTMSVNLTKLTARNQELAMQVSLLNCEVERILKELNQMKGEDIVRPQRAEEALYLEDEDEAAGQTGRFADFH